MEVEEAKKASRSGEPMTNDKDSTMANRVSVVRSSRQVSNVR